MTASAPFDPGNRDRFFRSMVLMGSSLALGCAGTSIHDGSPREDADDIAARAGTGGSAGTTSSAAGSAGMATSGSAGMATSGTGAGGAATTPVCPDEQRTCTSFTCHDDVWEQEGRCYCDFSRPASAADCGTGIFVCRPTPTDPETGAPLAEPTRVDCQCVPPGGSCSEACSDAYDAADRYACAQPAPGANDVLCGCSFVFLR